MEIDMDDWPRDVMMDLMMHLTRNGMPRAAEMLADALVVFEAERSQARLKEGARPAEPVLRVVPGGLAQN